MIARLALLAPAPLTVAALAWHIDGWMAVWAWADAAVLAVTVTMLARVTTPTVNEGK